jgi:hypothetical protein
MLLVSDKGPTRSGRSYLPKYLDRVPKERLPEFINKINRLRDVDLNTLFASMTITPKP